MTSDASQRLLSAIQCPDEICGLTHNLYRYPARFSPYFVRAAIEEFTRPGDLVFDPFMGGGTTLVEASVLGRKAVGIDINSLAVFVSKAKTQTIGIATSNWLRYGLKCSRQNQPSDIQRLLMRIW
jgi:DNA modification methylase